MPKQSLYTVGGTVQAGGGLYIARQADAELLKLCREGTFAYVLASRQMGKSSLMVRTSEQLLATGTQAVIVDLSQLGTQLAAEAWYLGFLTTIADSLMLNTDAVTWWQAHAALGTTQRLTNFFQEVLLAEIEPEARVVIFVDEIDSTLSLPFTDDFYAAIRYVYNARAQVPELRRLSFVLLGVATPSDLIADPRRTPFNIGQRVEVTDFTAAEALPLADGLALPPAQAQQVLTWVLDWTGGHPYLTQRLCRIIAEAEHGQWSGTEVAQLVARTFFGEHSEQDHNLQFVRDMLTRRAPEPVRVLTAYRTIRQGRCQVPDDEQSLVLAHLKLSGVVRRVQRTLRVRNRIYETVFDLHWVQEHWPVPWYKRVPPVVWGLLASLLAIVLLLGLLVQSQQRRVLQEQAAVERETKARQEAQDRQQEAEVARAEAERLRLVSLAQVLAAQALRQQDIAYQDERAALLARQAYLFNQRSQGEALDQIDDTLRTVLGKPYFQRLLRGHENSVWAVAFSPDGTTLASASTDRTVRLWMARTADLAALVCTTAWHNLMLPEWRQFVGRGIPYERTCPDLPLHPSVIQEAQELARAGDTEAALSLLRYALTLDPRLAFQPEVAVNTWAAQGFLDRGKEMERRGQVLEAIASYTEAQQRDPTLHISEDSWNSLCWFGSLWGQATGVLHACEQAVTLASDNGTFHDSRGLARALTGDYSGAIADFQFFVTWGHTQKMGATQIAQRQSWIKTLQAGQNPFDAATLKALRRETDAPERR